MDKKIKAKTAETKSNGTPTPAAAPTAYIVPAKVMEVIFRQIGKGAWLEVNELMNYITTNIQAAPEPEAQLEKAPVKLKKVEEETDEE